VAKIRQLFNAASIETAKRRRICHHNRKKHSIQAGERCLVLKDPSSGAAKNYCVECARDILTRAEVDLVDLRTQLFDGAAS
jgi:hypothetical protein